MAHSAALADRRAVAMGMNQITEAFAPMATAIFVRMCIL